MARLAQIVKELHRKYKVQHRSRCALCGRGRGFMRKFNMCRLCFRMRALNGEIPGVIKSSW